MNIPNFIEKNKQNINIINLFLLVILVFGLGKLDLYQVNSHKIQLLRPFILKENAKNTLENKGKTTIFASKNGSKYYYVWCKSGNRVKEENKIYFKDEEEAKKRGFDAAKNCK